MFVFSLKTVLLLLAMAIPGYIIAKTKLLKNSDAAVSFISIMLLYVCQPFVTFNSFLHTDYQENLLWNMLAVFAITAIIMAGLSLALKLAFSRHKDPEFRTTIPYAATFGNIGYLCVPFLQMLAPGNNTVMLYATSSIVAFNLIAWTIGNYILTGDRNYIKPQKALFNPVTLSFIAVLPLFLLNLNFNRFTSLAGIANICRLFAEMVGPLAMTLLGIKFAEITLKELFADYRIYISTAIKLLASPIIAFGLLYLTSLFMDISDIRLNVSALAAMPTATNLMMFSVLCKKDIKLSAKMVLVSTLFSILTIPLFLELSAKIF